MAPKILFAVGGALAMTSCGDAPTAPPIPFTVTVTATVQAEGFNTETARYECHYTLKATVNGEQGAEATWFGGAFEVRPDDGRASPDYELGLVAVVDMWGSSALRSGEQYEALRIAWDLDGPFMVRHTFRYVLDEEIRSVNVFTC